MGNPNKRRPVIFGEVLFDIFPDGREEMGGAPFNTAWNLAGLGLNPLFVSRIGKDERGKSVVGAMSRFGMDVSAVQIDNYLPTGVVEVDVETDHRKRKFGLPEAQAFDAIDGQIALKAAESVNVALLYHGTLPARSKVSLESLLLLKVKFNAHIYVDVNMRSPWVRGDTAVEMIKGATCVQANRGDFEMMVGACSFEGLDFLGMTGYLKDMAGVKYLLVTLGKGGAILSAGGTNVEFKSQYRQKVEDTTGCGDAFAAVIIAGMIKGWSIELTVDRANALAGAVSGIKGAVTEDKAFYTSKAKEWGLL
ncbi:MAG: PfkB family carbohydrate kinase [Nitrospinota bacterium]|nr:PfkB family carbohydrate kinase [Nitrospinota bacterium]